MLENKLLTIKGYRSNIKRKMSKARNTLHREVTKIFIDLSYIYFFFFIYLEQDMYRKLLKSCSKLT